MLKSIGFISEKKTKSWINKQRNMNKPEHNWAESDFLKN